MTLWFDCPECWQLVMCGAVWRCHCIGEQDLLCVCILSWGAVAFKCYDGIEVAEMMNIEHHSEVLLLENLQCNIQ